MYYIIILLTFLSFACNSKPYSGQNSFSSRQVKEYNSPVIFNIDSLDFVSKIDELNKKLDKSFVIFENQFFIIASNLSAEETDNIVGNTIVRAIDCFYNDYFEKSPNEITTIFLFKDDATYRNWAKKLFDDDDLSRFGYYKPSQRVMLMNISTGTGTLVHEMTHALVRFDFPDIPSWFNEGLGSLYERCSLNNKNIIGYVNWRLPRLQESFTKNEYIPLEDLVKMDENTFYNANSDLHYAEARYFCMYLQEKGMLKSFYKLYRDGFNNDMTGKTFIEKLFAKDLNSVDKEFVIWAKSLQYKE
ncbi:MAG: hypothetical protein EHM58_07300 [Ignavibacteriae bacterium]|nr:MAG: hypothetical protein EHM58_07300 [Ignavibacteriota bacterium]